MNSTSISIKKGLIPFIVGFSMLLMSEILFRLVICSPLIIFIVRLVIMHCSLLVSTYLVFFKYSHVKLSFKLIDYYFDSSFIYETVIMYVLALAYILINYAIKIADIPILSTFVSVTFILKTDKVFCIIGFLWSLFVNSTIEELYFRKCLLDNGYHYLSVILFTIWHFYMNLGGIVLAFIMAIVLARDYEKNKSYSRVVILHAFINLFIGVNYVLLGMV